MIASTYPAKIWPQEIRAFGNSYGVFGWAADCGVTTLVIPSMFDPTIENIDCLCELQLCGFAAGVLLLPINKRKDAGGD